MTGEDWDVVTEEYNEIEDVLPREAAALKKKHKRLADTKAPTGCGAKVPTPVKHVTLELLVRALLSVSRPPSPRLAAAQDG